MRIKEKSNQFWRKFPWHKENMENFFKSIAAICERCDSISFTHTHTYICTKAKPQSVQLLSSTFKSKLRIIQFFSGFLSSMKQWTIVTIHCRVNIIVVVVVVVTATTVPAIIIVVASQCTQKVDSFTQIHMPIQMHTYGHVFLWNTLAHTYLNPISILKHMTLINI